MSQSLWFRLRKRRSSGGYARVMHTLLGTAGGQGLMEGVDCLVLVAECIADAVWLRDIGGMDLRYT